MFCQRHMPIIIICWHFAHCFVLSKQKNRLPLNLLCVFWLENHKLSIWCKALTTDYWAQCFVKGIYAENNHTVCLVHKKRRGGSYFNLLCVFDCFLNTDIHLQFGFLLTQWNDIAACGGYDDWLQTTWNNSNVQVTHPFPMLNMCIRNKINVWSI